MIRVPGNIQSIYPDDYAATKTAHLPTYLQTFPQMLLLLLLTVLLTHTDMYLTRKSVHTSVQ